MILYLVLMNAFDPKPDALGACKMSICELQEGQDKSSFVAMQSGLGSPNAPGYPFQFPDAMAAYDAIYSEYHREPIYDNTDLHQVPKPAQRLGDAVIVSAYVIIESQPVAVDDGVTRKLKGSTRVR